MTYILYLISLLPLRVLYILSDMCYPMVYYVFRYRVRVVRENLRCSFPTADGAYLRKVEHEFYHYFCDYVFESIKLLSMSEAEIRRRMVFEGTEIFDELFKEHQFLIMYLGHYGNWEWISSLGLWTPKGVQTAQLYRPLHNGMMDRLFLRIRSHFGGENIDKSKSLRRMIEMRQKGEKSVIGFISDQSPEHFNIHDWIDFLHQDTAVFTGAERLGKKFDATFCYLDIERVKRGYYKARVCFMTDEAREVPDWQLTHQFFGLLEKTINRQPAYWLWSHKRWKHQRKTTQKGDEKEKK